MDTNLAMLRNLLDPLTEVASGLQHVSLLQGTKAYGVHLHPIPIPHHEHFHRDEHNNFYWLQEDHVRERSAAGGWAFSIWRPQLIVGPNHGVVMNLPPIIGAFAAICTSRAARSASPGGASWVWECVDTRLVADALAWSATSPNAVGETFNLTNGEVFEWRTLWPSFAETFGLEAGPDEPLSLAELLPASAELWDRIVTKHDLRPDQDGRPRRRVAPLRRLLLRPRSERGPTPGVRQHGEDQAGRVLWRVRHRGVVPLLAPGPIDRRVVPGP